MRLGGGGAIRKFFPSTQFVFEQLRIDAGGFVTGMQIAPDGTRLARTDTAGSWVLMPGSTLWRQTFSIQSMPSADAGFAKFSGTYAIAIAPTNSGRMYAYQSDTLNTVGYIFRTNDRGTTWVRTAFPSHPALAGDSGNPQTRLSGNYMVVDPQNQNIIFASTPSDGLWTTTNGGDSWSQVSTAQLPVSGTGGAHQGQGHVIAFDPTSPVSGNAKQGLYATSYGNGVYHSTDGGSTWTILNSAGMPTTHTILTVDQSGVLWMTDGSDPGGGNGKLWRYKAGAWQDQSALMPGGTTKENHLTGVIVDPTDAAHVIATVYLGNCFVTTTGTAATPTWLGPTTFSIVSTTNPWMQAANDPSLAISPLVYDPLQSGVLIAGCGIGVLHATAPTSNANVQWNGNDTIGIQNLVTNSGVSVPGGPLMLSAWDRPCWVITNPFAPQSNYFPNYINEIVRGLNTGYVRNNISTLVELDATNGAEVSSNGGATWSAMAALPSGVPGTYIGGNICAASNTNAVWCLANGGGVYCLTGGSLTGTPTWTAASFDTGATPTGGGWNDSSFYNRYSLALDEVDTTTYYQYNDGSGTNAGGVYKSTNGTSFTRVKVGAIEAGQNTYFSMFSVPNNAGHLYAAGMAYWNGPLPDTTKHLFKCTDRGVTWAQVPNVYSLFGLSLGIGRSSYPAIYILGWVSQDGGSTYSYGLWRSDDATTSWTRISDGFPNGNYDFVPFIVADKNTYGVVYFGFGGTGFAVGRYQ